MGVVLFEGVDTATTCGCTGPDIRPQISVSQTSQEAWKALEYSYIDSSAVRMWFSMQACLKPPRQWMEGVGREVQPVACVVGDASVLTHSLHTHPWCTSSTESYIVAPSSVRSVDHPFEAEQLWRLA